MEGKSRVLGGCVWLVRVFIDVIGFSLIFVLLGYDMSVMAEDAFDEAIVDIVTAESILTSTDIINV